MPVIDNSELINLCNDCGAVGFIPEASYDFDADARTVEVEDTSTIPAGDSLRLIKYRVHDCFGGWVTAQNDIVAGGHGFTSTPAVVISGGGGSGATAHAVVTNGKVTSIVVDTAGTGYSSDPIATLTGGGSGSGGVKLTVTRSTTTVASISVDTPDDPTVIDVSSLNLSKPLHLSVTILTENGIVADGGAYGLMASGDVANWDVQKSAAQEYASA